MPRAGAIMWFRTDLRIDDNPALRAAVESSDEVVCAYVFAPEDEGPWAPGDASRRWLARSLAALDTGLRERGAGLVLRCGPTVDALKALCAETGARTVYMGRRHEPLAARHDARVMEALRDEGIVTRVFETALLHDPGSLLTSSGTPYKVFTPFFRTAERLGHPRPPGPGPERIPGPSRLPRSEPVTTVEPRATVAAPGIAAWWSPGEHGAKERLRAFLASGLGAYAEERDRPDRAGTSRLSPHITFGEIDTRTVLAAAREAAAADERLARGADAFIRQLYWREFAYHLLHHFPHTAERPLRTRFEIFPWSRDDAGLMAWQRAETGYPIIDAGMRELAETGWMHNRVRLLVASFLTKDLLLPWLEGARWFWTSLVDADLADNTLGWQWVAGCGADAAPYFRVFNPVTQGERYDPEGAYVRRWLPELTRIPSRWIHRPWEAPAETLRAAGVRLGGTYPHPIIDHAEARKRALALYDALRAGKE